MPRHVTILGDRPGGPVPTAPRHGPPSRPAVVHDGPSGPHGAPAPRPHPAATTATVHRASGPLERSALVRAPLVLGNGHRRRRRTPWPMAALAVVGMTATLLLQLGGSAPVPTLQLAAPVRATVSGPPPALPW